MKLDLIDLWILDKLKSSITNMIPITFHGELSVVNDFVREMLALYIVGEIIVAVVKRKHAINQTKLFGRRRDG